MVSRMIIPLSKIVMKSVGSMIALMTAITARRTKGTAKKIW